MKFIELTQAQHDSGIQDRRITINTDNIVTFQSFKYSSGQVVTSLLFNNGYKIEVTETYKDIQDRITRSVR